MLMNRRLFLAGSGSLLAAPRLAMAQANLTMSSWVPPAHHITGYLRGWAEEVERATDGRVKFQMLSKHPSAPQGTLDAVKDGLIDLSFVTASYTPARHTLTTMPELPGFGATAEANSVAYSRVHWKRFHQAGEYKGVKLLGVFTHGPGQMLTKKKVATIEDLQGLKVRTGGGVAEAVARAIGASPFVKPAGESYELLSSGVADATFFPIEAVVSFKLEKVIAQATVFPGGLYSSSFGFFMNETKWAAISKRDQDAIDAIAGERIARVAGKSWDEVDRKGFEALRAAGVPVVNASPELAEEVRKRSEPLIQDWIGKATAKGVDGTAALAEFRDELKKAAAG